MSADHNSNGVPELIQIAGAKRLDWSAIRQKLASAKGPRYWQSLEELAQTDEFRAAVEQEFPGRSSEFVDPVSRRDFLKLASVTMALAGLTACTKQPLEPIIPYVRQPEEMVLGKPLYFATAMPLSGVGRPMLVKSHEGRPTKVEGNPQHPASLGGSDVFSQGSLYDLYDPDRSQTIQNLGEVKTWGNFLSAIRPKLQAQMALKGVGVRILTETVTSPTMAAQIQSLLQAMPQAKWHVWEPVNRDQVKLGAQQAFGTIVDTHYKIDAADVVVSLDADFLNSTFHGFSRLAREFSARRDPESGKPMLRFYAIESTPTNTGGKADHKLPVKASELEPAARALSGGNPGVSHSDAGAFFTALTKDLQAHRGSSVVIVGDHAPASVHALAHEINAALGNVGKTVFYTDPIEPNPAIQQQSIAQLMDDIIGKKVEMLFILGGNPAYTAPADAGFQQNLANVPLTVHLASHFNETSAFCQWHINEAHYLESWGDVRAEDGTISVIQPLIAPLYGGKSAYEVLAAIGPNPDQSSYEIVRAYWQQQNKSGDFELFWRRTVHDGFMANTALPAKSVTLKNAGGSPASTQAVSAQASQPPAGKIEINFRPDPTIYDGRFSNNAWLQEIPKPLSTLTWDNGVWFGPKLAEKLHVEMNDVVEIAAGGSKMEATVYVQPGQPDDSVTVFFGYGRTRAGHSGDGAGFNAYPLRSNGAPWLAFGDIRKLDKKIPLAKISPDQMEHERELVRVAALDDYQKNPHFAKDVEHVPEPGETLYPAFKYEGYKWGMSIDINKCIGCNACIVACQSENNIPVVGKSEILKRRPMHWLRVDTYYEGLDNPKIYFQPLPCMQCENAPCEYVCPVGATVHSTEGLNDMVYNRCVGTRYCSNNCPWKVRRFNFFLYQDWNTPQLKMMRNPEVSVRSRGVMEKCTYCTQRIVKTRIEAEKSERRIHDGEFTTACAQACPADAIVFGDMNDPASDVNKMKSSPRDYLLLGELNTRPRTSYRAGVSNPNPELKGKGEPGMAGEAGEHS
jgi:MoCo/4Fe-4S cofactor protein with predicted Tat translocation signal